MANMGVLILMGIVGNNGIVLLDRVNQYRQAGLDREEATLRAGRDRLRPILMTALTTVLGLLPLATIDRVHREDGGRRTYVFNYTPDEIEAGDYTLRIGIGEAGAIVESYALLRVRPRS